MARSVRSRVAPTDPVGALPGEDGTEPMPHALDRAGRATVEERALALGFDACGVAPAGDAPHLEFFDQWIAEGNHAGMDWLASSRDLRASTESILPRAQSVVAVALNYNQPNEPLPGQPRIARYALGRDYHKVLRKKLKELARWIEEAYPGAACRPCVDSAPIFERDFARLAGLGWFGKNTMLIDSRRGSWFFIGLLLTTAELPLSTPAIGGCGTCHACIEACPTGAIVFANGRWQVDARRCISYLTIEHEGPFPPETELAGWTFGCDICQEVCPFNQPRASQPLRAQVTSESDFLSRRNWPSLVQMANLPRERWDVTTQGSPVRRTGLEGLRRNAQKVLSEMERDLRAQRA